VRVRVCACVFMRIYVDYVCNKQLNYFRTSLLRLPIRQCLSGLNSKVTLLT